MNTTVKPGDLALIIPPMMRSAGKCVRVIRLLGTGMMIPGAGFNTPPGDGPYWEIDTLVPFFRAYGTREPMGEYPFAQERCLMPIQPPDALIKEEKADWIIPSLRNARPEMIT